MQTPALTTDPAAGAPESALSHSLLKCLLRGLAATLPDAGDADAEVAAEIREVACELFFAMQPRNPIEAATAARAVAAHFASMDMFARAARSGTSNDTALRLRANATTASRSFDAAARTLAKRPTKPATAPASVEPARESAPPRRSEGRHPGDARLDAAATALRPSSRSAMTWTPPPPNPLPQGEGEDFSPGFPAEAKALIAVEAADSLGDDGGRYPATTFATSAGDCRTSSS